jgi:CRISPR-associated protein Cas1
MAGLLPPLKPIAIKERLSILFIDRGNLDVLDGAFVVVDKNGVRTHVPVGGVACLMLEPGTRVSHAAVALASRVGRVRIGCSTTPKPSAAASCWSGGFERILAAW